MSDPEKPRLRSPIEAVRLRPGMYLGGTDIKALHHMIYEVLDHCAEEALAGKANHIEVRLKPDHVIQIRDDSPGLPIDAYAPTGKSKLETLFTERLITKDKLGLGPYLISGGLHGLGLFPINALSEWLTVKTTDQGFVWQQEYRAGVAQSPIVQVRALDANDSTGTSITFKPDFSIFAQNEFEYDRVAKRCRDLTYQIAELRIRLIDERGKQVRTEELYAPEGLLTLVGELARKAQPLHQPIGANLVVTAPRRPRKDKKQHQVGLQFAFVFTRMEQPITLSYANTVLTPDGGTHITALRRGIVQGLNRCRQGNPPRPFRWADIEPHLVGVISIRHPDPQFESPTKVRLSNPEIISAQTNTISGIFAEFAAEHPEQMQEILSVCGNP